MRRQQVVVDNPMRAATSATEARLPLQHVENASVDAIHGRIWTIFHERLMETQCYFRLLQCNATNSTLRLI